MGRFFISTLLIFTYFLYSSGRGVIPRDHYVELARLSGTNTSLVDDAGEQPRFAMDDPLADGSLTGLLAADDPLASPGNPPRTHQEIYEALWKGADVPMDTSSASKIDVLGYLLKRQVAKLRAVSNGLVELAFLVDSSASVGLENFFNELKFVKKLLADFTVAPDATRVAIITFSSKHRVELNVNQLVDDDATGRRHHKCALLNEDLPRITYVGGGTYTKGAFELAKKVLQAARPNSTRAVFLLTDGLSNGPTPVPVAQSLRADGVEVFAFGIRNGFIPELLDMASESKHEHCYILDSFAEFEALARRALHEDLHMGEFVEEAPDKCSSRCFGEGHCCDTAATCRCGTHTGSYHCVCPAGFYGSGLRGNCLSCPMGSYKRAALPGGINTCLPCPDQNHISPLNSTDPTQCVCRDGYQWDPVMHSCKIIHCPVLARPRNGEFVECSNVVNGACAIRCDRGYEVTGSSIRLCFSNGTWSGGDFSCQVKKCEVLTTPKNGSLHCTTDDFAFGTECRAGCDQGFRLIGSPTRRCLPIAYWDGLPVSCRPIQCPALQPVPHGTITPSQCTTARQDYGSVCKIACLHGFHRRGPKRKECMANGSWNNKFDPTQACVDYKSPFLDCPAPITTETAHNLDRAVVEWTVPRPTDNSGDVPLLRASPNVQSPWTFPLGSWNITYTSMDQSGNIAECVFNVVVIDREPPSIRRCRSPSTLITSRKRHRVTWEEPIFADNSGGDVTVTQTHQSGDTFPLGTTTVEYLAVDAAGNRRSCVIYVDVQQNLCQKPRDPVGGSAVCFQNTHGMNCSVTCGPGYALSTSPRKQYFCALNGTWYPDGKVPWDDCSETHHANNVLQPMTFLYETSDCDTEFARNMERALATSLGKPIREYCGERVRCELASVKAQCGNDDAFSFIRAASTSGRQLQPTINTGPQQALEGAGDVTLSEDRLRLLSTPNLYVNVVVNASATNQTTALTGPSTQTYDMVVAIATSVPTRIQYDLMNNSLPPDVNRSVAAEEDNRQEEEEERRVRVGRISVFRKDIEPICAPGSVRRGDGRDAACAKCIAGTYFDESTLVCKYCEIGSYQPREGELHCLPCPNGTSTAYPKSTSVEECKGVCPPGTNSTTGLEVCEMCPKNTYQPQAGSTGCLHCPRMKETATHGATAQTDCKSLCPRGSVSATGLTPCLPCPAGTFKMNPKTDYCLVCPKDYPISNPGSLAITFCTNSANQRSPGRLMMAVRRLPFSECFSNPCSNGATCEPSPAGYTCACAPGYEGVRCDTEVNECEANACMNNGTCIDLLDDYQCVCPDGFMGRNCTEDLDECGSNPCFNGATCIDGPNYYECLCPEGYTGARCDSDIDECASAPCYHHGLCTDHMGGFNCTCRPGYYGALCEMEMNECDSYPCLNNATCLDQENRFSCQCVDGFSGELCETDIDECVSSPCLNGALCTDLIGTIRCTCPPAFTGQLCEEDMRWDFNLVFEQDEIDDYVRLTRDFPALHAVTIAFWMQTDNTQNYGTVFSYAVSDASANTLTLTDYTGFVLNVNEEKVVSDIVANDGWWHHVVVTWESHDGAYRMFRDGELQASGTGLANGTHIPGDGILVLGQDQDSLGGGFTHGEAFLGELTLVNVWPRALTDAEVHALGRSCERPWDVIIAWPDFLPGVHGEVKPVENNFCQGCPTPPRPEAGLVHDYVPSLPLNVVTYHCLPGYSLPRYEVSSAECQISGQWTPSDQAFCERISCGHPGPMAHGYVIGSNFLFGDRVFYQCRDNFTLVGPFSRECQANGYWSEYTPGCNYVICREPPYVPNSKVTFPGHSMRPPIVAFPGHNAIYHCSTGYRLFSLPNVTCQTNGEWTAPPTCRIVTCPPLPPSQNPMLLMSNGSVYSSLAEYGCATGYNLIGESQLRCHDTGKWSNPLPSCELLSCGDPPEIRFANSSVSGITYGSSVVYMCYEGYKTDQNVIHCGSTGSWEPSPPDCRRIQCPFPPPVEHGLMRGQDFGYRSVIQYECDRGYVLSGKTELICESNGQWSQTPPECHPVSCGPPPFPKENYILEAHQQREIQYTFGMTTRYSCQDGYIFDSENQELWCGPDGFWEGLLAGCSPISCGPPRQLPYGFRQGNNFTYNHTVSYHCNAGFTMIGDPSISCTASGHWTELGAQCQRISCRKPPSIQNANVTSDRLYNQTVQYTCNPGYISIGSTRMTCSADGTWHGIPPTCDPVTCGSPIAPRNGFTIGTNHTFTSLVKVGCNDGYNLTGNPFLQCLSSGQWSNGSGECLPVSCGIPPAISRGAVLYKDYHFQSLADYTCERGFILKGPSSQKCAANGEWTPAAPMCQPVDCGRPDFLKHALIYGSNFTYNSTIAYDCEDGYTFDEDVELQEIICQADGTWNENYTKCQIVDCGEPDHPQNGYHEAQAFTHLSSVEYVCLPGFFLNGSLTRNCTADGTWSGATPTCDPLDCGEPPPITNAALSGETHTTTTTFGSKVTYECLPGFEAAGDVVAVCDEMGTWNGSASNTSCQRIQCLEAMVIHNGAVQEMGPYQFGDTVHVVCDEGYREGNTTEMKCGEHGAWVPLEISCKAITCLPAEPPGNGTIVAESVSYGGRTVFECKEGFNMSGDGTIVCGENGEWVGEIPNCVHVTCDQPDAPQYGEVLMEGYTYGSQAHFSCDFGFDLDGASSIWCNASGMWSNPTPLCSPVECGPPRNPEHGIAIFVNTHYMAEVSYDCEPGYRLRGNGSAHCQADGTWSGMPPVCQLIECKVNGAFPLGVVIRNRTVPWGDKVLYSCNPGFKITGQSFRVCNQDGQLTGQQPECTRISCGPPPELLNGSVSYTTDWFQSNATYSCGPGLNLEGPPMRYCLEDGSWSSGNQSCRVITCPLPPDIQNGLIVSLGNLEWMEQIECSCNEGYRVHGGDVLRSCQEDRSWSGTAPECHLISCDEPPILENGVRSYDSVTFNSTALYDCQTGFNMLGPEVLRCLVDGQWHPALPTCQKVTCGTLQNPQSGRVIFSEKVYGSEALYVCNEGHAVVGEHRRICMSTGEWSEEAPTCAAKPCVALPLIEHAVYPAEKTVFVYGDFVQLECEEGYTPTGDGGATCLPDQTWSLNNFSCDSAECNRPSAPTNGTARYMSLSIGSTVTYSCDEGFTLVGQSSVRCQGDQQWSGLSPKCEVTLCPAVPRPDNMVISATGNRSGDTVTITCAPGFNLAGASRLVCTLTGEWSSPFPACIADGCGPPPMIQNGIALGSNFLPGNTVSFRCMRGYQLLGSSSILCLPNHSWSDTPPQCVAYASIAALQDRPVCVLPCLHGGTCVGPYNCECPYGFAGARCEHVLCVSRCINGARCSGRHEACRR